MDNELLWLEVQKQYCLSDDTIVMAKSLGMNPKKLNRLANRHEKPWKTSLPEFIHHLYEKQGRVSIQS
jgi:hypothetical protein